MRPTALLTKVIVFVLAVLLAVPIATVAQDDEDQDRDDRRPQGSDDDETEDEDEDEDEAKEDGRRSGRDDGRDGADRRDRSAAGRGGDDDDEDDDDDDDRDDDEDDREIRHSVSRQVGRFDLADGGVDGRFVAFQIASGGIVNYSYRGHVVFETIRFAPALDAEQIEVKGAKFEAEGDDAEFKAVDTPSGHFKAETDDGTLTFTLAPDFTATPFDDRSGHGRSKVAIRGLDLTMYLQGEDLQVDNGTIVAEEEARFVVHAPGLRGNLSPKISQAAEDGRIGAEVLVTRNDDGPEDAVPAAYGPYNLSVESGGRSVRLTIEGHGDGTALLFDLERDALGRAEDLVILFDGERIEMADDIEDVLNTTADEPAEYILIVGHNKTQVLVSVPHFSVHTVEISTLSAGPVEIIEAITGSALALGIAAAAAVGFVAITWGIRNRQR